MLSTAALGLHHCFKHITVFLTRHHHYCLVATQGAGVELNELSVKPAEFTRVHIQGEFDHESSIYVGPRPRSSMGSATNG